MIFCYQFQFIVTRWIPQMLSMMIPCCRFWRSPQNGERLGGADVKIKCDARRGNLLFGRFCRRPNLACQILRFSDSCEDSLTLWQCECSSGLFWGIQQLYVICTTKNKIYVSQHYQHFSSLTVFDKYLDMYLLAQF